MPSNGDSPFLRAASAFSRSRISLFRSPSASPSPSPSPSPSATPSPNLSSRSTFAKSPSPPPLGSSTAFTQNRRRSSNKRESVKQLTPQAGPPIFTNLDPFASLPYESAPPPTHRGHRRRESAELRAVAANRLRMVTFSDGQGKRRKSVVEIDTMTDAVRSTRLSSIKAERRRSSAHRRRSSASIATPRQSVSCASQSLQAADNFIPRLPLPESPKLSPLPFSPIIAERRPAFSDEPISPISDSTFSTLPSPTFSTAFSTISSSSNRTARLRPRSPQTASFTDPMSFHHESHRKPDESIESPSGVRIRFPLVFPSRPPPSPRPPQSFVFDHDQVDEPPTPSDDELTTPTAIDHDYFTDLPPPLPPKFKVCSPFPPPLESQLSAHPRPQPQLRLDLSFIGSPSVQRKFSNSSSYRPSPPDHLVGTPGTIALFRTGTHTSTSTYTSNVFSEAFATSSSNY